MKKNDINTEKKSFPLKTVVIVAIAVILAIMVPKLLFGQENLLENPGFETGLLNPWEAQEQFPEQCCVDTIYNSGQYSANIEVISPGEFWEVQLYQLLNLKQGQRYVFNFYYKSSAPSEIILNLCGNEDPWPFLGLWDSVATDSNWSYYSTDFIAFDTLTARLSFNFGHQHSKFWIDDVYLAESVYVDPEPAPPPDPEDVESIYLYPNPFQNCVYLALPENLIETEVEIYNIVGQKLEIPIEDSLLNFANEPPGVYLVAVGSMVQKIVKLE